MRLLRSVPVHIAARVPPMLDYQQPAVNSTASHASVASLTTGHPKLSLTVASGTNAPAIGTITFAYPAIRASTRLIKKADRKRAGTLRVTVHTSSANHQTTTL
jgi:hypothetical protein